MSKKTMLLALAAVSAAVLAVPAMASAAVPVIDNGTSFTGTFGLSTLQATNEPEVKCLGENHVNGTVNAGGTTGNITLDYTNCHIEPLGITDPCKTAGAPVNNTIAVSAVWHTDYVNAAGGTKKPGVKVTAPLTVVECAFTTPIEVQGSLLGTITAPACGGSSLTGTLAFKSTSSTQEHQTDEGGTGIHLVYNTKGGSSLPAGLTTESTITFNTTSTLTCP